MIEGQSTLDQITSDEGFKLASQDCILCIPFIVSGSPSES